MAQTKNRVSGLLLETGVTHNKQRLHQLKYFRELLAGNEEVSESIRPLLRLSRESIVWFQKTEAALVRSLERDPALVERVKNLKTVPGEGHHGAHLGAGNGRCVSFPLCEASD